MPFPDLTRIDQSRDLSLPLWGTYSKDHFALSHIADPGLGRLFECLLVPGIHAQRVYFPDKREAWDWIPVEADPDLSFYRMRCRMHGADAEITVQGSGEENRLVEVIFRNHATSEAAFRLDCILGLQTEEPRVRMELRPGEHFLPAAGYESLNIALPATAVDHAREGTVPGGGFVGRLALGPAFFSRRGARASYRWQLSPAAGGSLFLRYGLIGDSAARIRLRIGSYEEDVELRPTGKVLQSNAISLTGPVWNGRMQEEIDLALEVIEPPEGSQLYLDGIFLLPDGVDLEAEGRLRVEEFSPRLDRHVEENFAAVRSPLLGGRAYGVMVEAPVAFHGWTLKAREIGPTFRRMGSTSRYWTRDREIDGGNEHLFADLRPLFCPPHGEVRVRAVVGYGRGIDGLKNSLRTALVEWKRPQRKRFSAAAVAREEFRRSLNAVTAATLTTVCYPQELGGEWVRHFSPGAFFPTLYQWDAGMQSIGMMDHAPQLALENLLTYWPPPGDPMPIVLHGTVLPTQLFFFWELFQKTGDAAILRRLYPRARRFLRFMLGQDGSHMNPFGTGLLCPWKYFYNSAGWDDYPAQAHVAANRLGDEVSPVANTAYTARAAKLMALVARELGFEEEESEFLASAAHLMKALEVYSWDESSGYFSYVINDGKKHLAWTDGSNFNRGLDGVTPLVAGWRDDAVRRALLAHCRSPEELWTDIGLSTVDQSAPYFSWDGYWNGTVWIAHQWFFFKAFLDCGEAGLARELARAVCEGWRSAVDGHDGQTFEAIHIRTRRGMGTPYFSALSVPVVPIYHAAYTAGRLTGGFDTVVSGVSFDPEQNRLTAELANPHRPGATGLLCVMSGPGRYRLKWQGGEAFQEADSDGCLALRLELSASRCRLVVEKDL